MITTSTQEKNIFKWPSNWLSVQAPCHRGNSFYAGRQPWSWPRAALLASAQLQKQGPGAGRTQPCHQVEIPHGGYPGP